ncbi:MAG: universal stress protein [Candidatus Tectomicrobia bacterium]|uniref:Universal stress protein n=1 Tax=Tectimicrobiota bacterium TaxID=2528274 RepID=A0A938B5J3_UNCTE|nr:universal stress protein [Candidatus Tectomicrobia bacterium]
MKILIAYDGSQCADAALHDLQRAGLPQHAEALIVAIADVVPPPAQPLAETYPTQVPPAVRRAWQEAATAVEEAHTLAQRACAQVQTLFPHWQVQAEASADSPAWGVIKQADAWHPDLLVVGSHGRSALGRLVLGSVSQTVVREAHCAVRVARAGRQSSETPAQLVIGVDGSPDARAAVDTMAARRWPAGSTVTLGAVLDARLLVSLMPTPPFDEAWTRAGDAATTERVQALLQPLLPPLQAAGLTVTTLIRDGDPKHLLPEIAAQCEADCLVVGARGLSRIERFLLGSVSTAVAARAHCSVEIIRGGKVENP